MNSASAFETIERIFHDWKYGHPKVIYGLIRALKPEVVVEVGTYRGYAACYMARAIQENNHGHLYCIDAFTLRDHEARTGQNPIDHWNANLTAAGVRSWATLIQGYSEEVEWPKRVDLAYIDGWHSYATTLNDFHLCAERGAQTICLDDTLNCVGPSRVIAELDMSEWNFITLPNDNGLTVCQRKASRRPTFSQEIPEHPGVDITRFTNDEVKQHLKEAAEMGAPEWDCKAMTSVGFTTPAPSGR